MAARLGLTSSAYAWYESGQRESGIKNLNYLAIFFWVSVDYLVNGAEKSDAQENTNDKLKSVENFWESAGYEVNVSDDETLSRVLSDNFKTVFRLDNDNFVKSINKKNRSSLKTWPTLSDLPIFGTKLKNSDTKNIVLECSL